jgi:hypothetical protein
MEVTTLVIAIIGAVTGVGSLLWQVIMWRQSGPVVTVTATQTIPLYRDHAGDAHVAVTARNTGRSPITVNQWGLQRPDGYVTWLPQNLPSSTPLPHRLEPGTEGNWYVATREIIQSCAEHSGNYQELTAFVGLANGKKVYAKKPGIGLKPDETAERRGPQP